MNIMKKKAKKTKSKARPNTKRKTPVRPKAKKAVKKKRVGKVVATTKPSKPIGVVTHFFNHIRVAIVKCKSPIKRGTEIRFKGATTDFSTNIQSMQYDHKPIIVTKKGQEVGIKVKKKVREGDMVYLA